MFKKKRVRALMGLLVLALAASACLPTINMTPGQTITSNCAPGQEATFAVDDNAAGLGGYVTMRCDHDDATMRTFKCPDGIPNGKQVDFDSVLVQCDEILMGVFDETAEEDPAMYQAVLAEQAAMEGPAAMSTAAAGDGCWRARPSYETYYGSSLNARTIATIEWCVVNGLVKGGVQWPTTVHEGRFYEVGDGVQKWITPYNRTSRLINMDWDFRFGWCPACTGIDWDLEMTITKAGRYYGYWRNNGKGI